MPRTPEFSPEEEERIQQKKEQFQHLLEEHKKQVGSVGLLSIDPGNDPLAREAMTRVMEQSIEQTLASQEGQTIDSQTLLSIKAELREQVKALFARKDDSGSKHGSDS